MKSVIDRYLARLATAIDVEEPVQQSGLRLTAGIAVLAAVLALTVQHFYGYHWGFATLNQWGRNLPALPLSILTYAGDTLTALTLMLMFTLRHPRVLWTAVIAAVVATLISHGLKNSFDTLRPAAVLEADQLRLVGEVYRKHGFPSGHTTTAFVLAGCFAIFARPLWVAPLSFALAALIGLSRVWVGAHWMLDVLGGAAVGCVSALIATQITLHWHWGQRALGHLILVVLLIGCAIALCLVPSPYPLAAPAARLLGAAALAIAIWRYARLLRMEPRTRRRARAW